MNAVVLSGRITNDLVLKTVGQGKMEKVNFTIADNRTKVKDGEYMPQYFSCVAFGTIAKNMILHLEKGSSVIVQGHLQQDVYRTEDGQRREAIKVYVEKIDFL